MRNGRCSRVINIGIVLLVLPGMSIVRSAQAACYGTPRAAVEAYMVNSPVPSALNDEGYQVTRISSDSVLGRRWATIASCSHRNWPLLAVPVPGAKPAVVPPAETHRSLTENVEKTPLVRAGDIV